MAEVIKKYMKDGKYYREWDDNDVEEIAEWTYNNRDLDVTPNGEKPGPLFAKPFNAKPKNKIYE